MNRKDVTIAANQPSLSRATSVFVNIALFRQILNIEADITVRFFDFVSSAGAGH
jgi:hypothetical protein